VFKRVDRAQNRKKKHLRLRNQIEGTAQRPRLNVFRSAKHIYAQIIDDEQGRTLVSASTIDPAFRAQSETGGTRDAARQVGRLVAERAKEQGITRVVFDRGGYIYHGRIQALADGAREGGLEF